MSLRFENDSSRIDNKFTRTFTPTIGVDFKFQTIHVRDKPVKLQLWDTAGQEKFFSIVQSYYVSCVDCLVSNDYPLILA